MLKVRKWEQDGPKDYAKPAVPLYVLYGGDIVIALTEEECRNLAAQLLAVLEEEPK